MTANEYYQVACDKCSHAGIGPCRACVVAVIHTAMLDEKEMCAKKLEAWADSQDRIALLKEEDAPCSAMSHAESAIIGRRMANVVKRLDTE